MVLQLLTYATLITLIIITRPIVIIIVILFSERSCDS